MSAIAGVYWRDPRAAPPNLSEIVARMLDRMADRGGDQRGVHSDAGVCIGADITWTTPGAERDQQPLILADPPLWIAVDGRLDNHEEIDGRVGGRGALTDAGLIASWLRMPRADLAALIGDFSFATFDPRERRLRLVRDALGVRSLYYAETPDVIWFASSLAAMVSVEWYRPEINEGFIAEYLSDVPATVDETPFAGIRRLPQAHVLEVTGAAVHRRAFWTLDIRDERRVTEGAAIEEFQSLFSASVRARLRSRSPVAFQLSGGLDSSTVVGVARALGISTPDTYSLVYPDVPVADESAFIDAVVAFNGARSVRFPVHRFPVQGLDVFAGATRTADLADFATGQWVQTPFLRRASADGHRVMLTGCGGDEWLSGSIFRIPALVKQGRLLAAWRAAQEYRNLAWCNPGAMAILRTTAASVLPGPVKAVLRAAGAGRRPRTWLTPDFVQRVNVSQRMRASYNRAAGRRHLVVRESLVRLTSGESGFVRDALDRMGHGANIELRHPYFDRRVVEFLIGLPDDLRLHRGVHRHLLRRAYGHVLPEIVRTRLGKPDIEHLVHDSLLAIDPPAWFDRLEVEARGWVSAGAVRELWQRPERSGHFALWSIFAVEAWVRAWFPARS